MPNFRDNRIIGAIRLRAHAFHIWITPRDLYDSIQPYLLLFLLLGTMPFRLVGPRGAKRLKPTIIGGLITVTYIVLFGVSYWNTITLPKILIAHFVFNKLSTFIDTFRITAVLVALLWMLLGCVIQRRNFACLINLLSAIDEKLIGLNGHVRHEATLWLLCRRLVYSILFYIPNVVLTRVLLTSIHRNRAYNHAFISYFMPHIVMLCFLLKWRTVIHLLHRRFQVLNEVSFRYNISTKSILLIQLFQILASLHQNTNLQHDRKTMKAKRILETNVPFYRNQGNINENDKNVFVPIMEPDNGSELNVIESACRIHEDLCDACYITEGFFSMMMLTIVTFAFLIIVFNAYFAVDVASLILHDGAKMYSRHFWFYLAYQLFIHGLALSYIVQDSSDVLLEVRFCGCCMSIIVHNYILHIHKNEKCTIHVLKLMNRVTTKAAHQKLVEFSQQLLNRKVRFTAMNLFPLEKSLILTVIF